MNVRDETLRIFVWKPLRFVASTLAAAFLTVLFVFASEHWIRAQGDAEVPTGHRTLRTLHSSMQPRERRSAAVRRLEELGAPLGLDLARRQQAGARPSAEEEGFRLLKKDDLKQWLAELEARPDDADIEAPAAVRVFLARHDQAISLLAAHLREHGEELEWELDPNDLFNSPLPNLAGILDAVRILEAATIEADRMGDGVKAHQLLDASFRLAESVERRPEMICFVISLAIDGMHHAQVRRLRHPVQEWATRLSRRDLVEALQAALRMDALALQGAGSSPASGFPGILRPYVDLQLADTARRLDRVAFALGNLTWAGVQGGDPGKLWRNPCPPWNIVGRIAWPDYTSLPYRVVRRNLDREVTSLIVQAKSSDRGSCEVESRSVPGKKLRLDRLAAGRFRVEALVGLEEPPPDMTWRLPIRFMGMP